jgi:fatty acid desaturase
LTAVPFLSPGCAIFADGGRQSLEEQPTMDKVVSLLISVGIITFGAWVAAATIAKGWPLVWTLMALFPLLTGFISLYDSIKGTED